MQENTSANYTYFWWNPVAKQDKTLKNLSDKVIKPAIRNVEAKYSLKVKEIQQLAQINTPNTQHKATPKIYLLVGPVYVDNAEDYLQFYTILQKFTSKTSALVNIFPVIHLKGKNPITAYKTGSYVRSLDLKDGSNHLFPDDTTGRLLHPSQLDVESNIICETFHNKISTIFLNHHTTLKRLTSLRKHYSTFITSLAKMIRKNKFHDRAPTDGAIVIKHTTKQFLVTAEKTDKTKLTANDFVLVSQINIRANTVTQTGYKHHTSDVELIQLATLLDTRYIVHLHTPNKAFSRAWIYPEYTTKKEYPYGELQYSKEIYREALDIFQRTGQSSVFNLRNHGLVFAVDSLGELRLWFNKLLPHAKHLHSNN